MKIFRGKDLPNGYIYVFLGILVGNFVVFVLRPNFSEQLANVFIIAFFCIFGFSLLSVFQGKNGLRHEIHLTDTQIIFARLGHGRIHRDFYEKETLLNVAEIKITTNEEMPKLFYKLKTGDVKSFELKNWDDLHIQSFINYMQLTHRTIKIEKSDNNSIIKLFS